MVAPCRKCATRRPISASLHSNLSTWLLLASLLVASRVPLTAGQRLSHALARRDRNRTPPLRERFASAYARTRALAGNDGPVFLRPIAASREESQASHGSRTRVSRSLIRRQREQEPVGNPKVASVTTVTTPGNGVTTPGSTTAANRRGIAAILREPQGAMEPSAPPPAAASHALAARIGPLADSGSKGGSRKVVAGARRKSGPIGILPHWGANCMGRACGVMDRPISVYAVWYGAFSEPQKAAVRTLTASLSPSAEPSVTVPLWWNINRLYYDSSGNYISESVTWGGEIEDRDYSKGKTLSDGDVRNLIANAISSAKLPYNEDGVYFVVSDETVSQVWTSPGANSAAFCSSFCGWHWYSRASSFGSFVYSWVGNARAKCPTSCITRSLRANLAAPPNQDAGIDGLLSVFAHELAEATSSPFVSTWYDRSGQENADKCSWEFSPILTDPSGARCRACGPPAQVLLQRIVIMYNKITAAAALGAVAEGVGGMVAAGGKVGTVGGKGEEGGREGKAVEREEGEMEEGGKAGEEMEGGVLVGGETEGGTGDGEGERAAEGGREAREEGKVGRVGRVGMGEEEGKRDRAW
ncbi:hypothetical protein CLOM_g18866 [Closterium sp. NIES-68]|nr:hypothetical protein CLOM_g18866 [Closterium sp. NIES-68]